jgi:cob(I)alamin adenosyltransferase
MAKIYTKYGDRGHTFTKSNPKTPKNEIIIHLLGEIDELNSCVGHLTALIDNNLKKDCIVKILHQVMSTLFSVGAYVGYDTVIDIKKLDEFIFKLEDEIDKFENDNGEIRNFILPTGGMCSSYAQVCRAVCRRVERNLYDLTSLADVEVIGMFFNRLSDFLFSLARTCNRFEVKKEIIWNNFLAVQS